MNKMSFEEFGRDFNAYRWDDGAVRLCAWDTEFTTTDDAIAALREAAGWLEREQASAIEAPELVATWCESTQRWEVFDHDTGNFVRRCDGSLAAVAATLGLTAARFVAEDGVSVVWVDASDTWREVWVETNGD